MSTQTTTDQPPTKVLLSLTIFDEDIILCPFLQTIANLTKYKIHKKTTGVHRQANRVHRHLMIIYDIENNRQYKSFNKKCQNIWKSIEMYKDIPLKATFTYNNNGFKSNPKHQYDESCLMYPFKEYPHDNDIEYDYQKGFLYEELHEMRATAHAKWMETLATKQLKEKKKDESQHKKLQLYKYLNQKTHYMRTSSITHDRKIRETVVLILEYKHQIDDSFRLYDLKNLAVNYLWKHNLISHFEILEILNM